MPSKTDKQKRTMRAACKSPKFRKKVGIPKKVACEFYRADRNNTGHRLTGRNQ